MVQTLEDLLPIMSLREWFKLLHKMERTGFSHFKYDILADDEFVGHCVIWTDNPHDISIETEIQEVIDELEKFEDDFPIC